MTFDDFKKKFEIFSKIDTAEKLAICESQYEKHLLHIEDENYFEPTEKDLEHDIVSQYENNLNRIVCFDAIRENQICFLVKPSFDPEHLLILEKLQDRFTLTLTMLKKNYWTIFYADNKITDIEKKVITTELDITTGHKLFNLLEKVIMQAQLPRAGKFMLDGIEYRLSKFSNGKQKTVSKHSPSETSRSGQIIVIMRQLIDNINHLENNILLGIQTKITALQI